MAKRKSASKKSSTKKKSDSQLDLYGSAESAPTKSKGAGAASGKTSARSAKAEKTAPTIRRGKAGKSKTPEKVTAESMALRQREISVSEFFTKNRHLLGFDNPAKALLTTVKEAVDNSLDACEEAGILPEIWVRIDNTGENRFRVTIRDNGPGIVKAQIPKIFGKLLYGSKFHRLKQSRGQQGIGISAAGMYGHLTTGKPLSVVSRTGKGKQAHAFDIEINTRTNNPEVLRDETVEFDLDHGTEVRIELEATYKRGKHSVDDYLQYTAVANPHAQVHYRAPDGQEVSYTRSANELPSEAKEIKPHPHGVELGALIKIVRDSPARNIKGVLTSDFSRVSDKVADDILKRANLGKSKKPREVSPGEIEKLFKVIGDTQLLAPPTNCLSPIGEELLRKSLAARFKADVIITRTRRPAVYRGNPFLVEAGLAYGGELPHDDLADVLRLANRVPLQYQASACAITKTVLSVEWKSYGLQQSRGALPTGPLVIAVHIASAWVPFTSESKEAIASYPEIQKEIRLALQDCGRELARHIRTRRREAEELKKRSYIEKYIPHIGIALRQILELNEKDELEIVEVLKDTLERSRKRPAVSGNVEAVLAEHEES